MGKDRKGRDPIVPFRIAPGDLEELDRSAALLGEPRSSLIRFALREARVIGGRDENQKEETQGDG